MAWSGIQLALLPCEGVKIMNKQQYRVVRRTIRDNGRYVYKYFGDLGDKLRDLADSQDYLAERADIVAYCKREQIQVNFRHLMRRG